MEQNEPGKQEDPQVHAVFEIVTVNSYNHVVIFTCRLYLLSGYFQQTLGLFTYMY